MARPSPDPGSHAAGGGYERRRPEETALYDVVRSEVETFLARDRDRPLPRFVERELRAYLECGILAYGFLRVHCDACGHDRVVAFSCKGRGFCPSCGGRRMADTAAHLVDRVLPRAGVRQWVLTLPFALRYRLAFDAHLTSAVLREFVLEVFASYRRRARRCQPALRRQPTHRGPAGRRTRGGAVTFIQRFADALNLNVHFHTLVLDGVYENYGEPGMRFRPLPPPDDAEVARVVERVAARIARPLDRRGPGSDSEVVDPLTLDQPRLAGLAAASVRGLNGDGHHPARRGDRIEPDDLSEPAISLCAAASGFTLHAGVAVPPSGRRRLERLCRYVARPPLSTERLERLPDGRLLYRLRHRWRDGTTALLLEPRQLLERLVPLIPAPRAHLVRYHGVLAPCAGWRHCVVPVPPASIPAPCRIPTLGPDEPSAPAAAVPRGPRRYPWADLLRRVFAVDALTCPDCSGRMRILAAIHPPESAGAILDCLGLPSRPPPLDPPRYAHEHLNQASADW
jgi:Putative transposase/Transposase zinc-binding domain